MHYKYKIIPELKVILGVHFGITKFEDLVKMKTNICQDPLYNTEFSNIADLTETEFRLSDKERQQYAEIVRKIGNLTKPIKTALITKTPNQVVNSTFYAELAKELPVKFLIVSTADTALNFIGIPNEKHEFIKKEINKMKKDLIKQQS